MKAKEIERQFDAGKDMGDTFDLSKGTRINQAPKRVNVDFPAWVIKGLDKEACRMGVTRQSVIKFWITERLEQTAKA